MSHTQIFLEPRTRQLYVDVLNLLNESGIPYLVGGAYALAQYSGIERHTKDLDLFVLKEDAEDVLRLFAKEGYKTEMTFSHWLGKIFKGDQFIDIIFSSGNAIADVDEEWFEHAPEAEVFGVKVKLSPPEEMIWSKAFIMERERFDGADVAHIIQACADTLDWDRLLRRFGAHWKVLLTHLLLFGYIYPAEQNKIPGWVLKPLLHRVENDATTVIEEEEPLCQGTCLSREQYLFDVERRGYADGRLEPRGKMSAAEIDHWTIAIDSSKH
ncbi:nucleotidyltransferase [Candidatus Obscuribacterales bacterium]|nr:nucleotidyltransferase [Candidatus Obscuribacterales bacterium]MBX3136507.1 nucleotidyltransferase [Candidatus Obscuribacterales bacterium]MBX3151245.1 nucleotidyltransferase [Candidatus Obscuribacterales bacterium]